METVIITKRNLKKYYNNIAGNLYLLDTKQVPMRWEVVAGLSLAECKSALRHKTSLVYIEGPVRELNVY